MTVDLAAELYLDGGWVDLKAEGVFTRDQVDITYGRSNWAGTPSPAKAGLTLDNSSGKWSPDNPLSPVYGAYKRNLPLRVGVGTGEGYATYLDNGLLPVATTPNYAGLQITGDIDIRAEVQPSKDLEDYGLPTGRRSVIVGNVTSTTGYALCMYEYQGALKLGFRWCDSGGVARIVEAELPWSANSSRLCVRATFQPATGVGTFYTGTDFTTWNLIGSQTFGATTMAVSTSLMHVGSNTPPPLTEYGPFAGKIYRAQIRSGIGGTIVLDTNFATAVKGAATFTDGLGKVWTAGAGGKFSDVSWRFSGELASLPVRWDVQGRDVSAPIEAAGIFRRLKQGAKSLNSPLRRAIERAANVVGYWPMEEAQTGQINRFNPAIGGSPIITYGPIDGSSNEKFPSSDKIPTLGTGALVVFPSAYTVGTSWSIRFLLYLPAAITGAVKDFVEIQTSDLTYLVRYDAATLGNLQLLAYRAGVLVHSSASVVMNMHDRPGRLEINAVQNGANVDYGVTLHILGDSAPGGFTGTITGATSGRVSKIVINRGNDFTPAAVGHLCLYSVKPNDSQLAHLDGYLGETAANRISRLCAEEGIASRIIGNPNEGAPMGPQTSSTLFDLLEEAADTDLGILFEPQDSIGVGYRTAPSMYNQDAGILFDYAEGHIVGSPELDRDDQGFSNDVTVENYDKGFYRAQITTGDLSIQQPPLGAGKYDSSFKVSTAATAMIDSYAYTRLAHYSVDEPRISHVATDLDLDQVKTNTTLKNQVLNAHLGDILEIDSPLPLAAQGTLRQAIQGVSEKIGTHHHLIEYNTTSAQPWDSGVLDDTARYDTAGSVLAAASAINATSLSVTTVTGPIWTTAVGEFPLDILVNGVRVNVTAIAGTGTTQTFTVNPATTIRAFPIGAKVELADSTLYTL